MYASGRIIMCSVMAPSKTRITLCTIPSPRNNVLANGCKLFSEFPMTQGVGISRYSSDLFIEIPENRCIAAGTDVLRDTCPLEISECKGSINFEHYEDNKKGCQ